MSRLTTRLAAAALLLLAIAPVAHAQASRTWVSGVGDDANPCSRTAPCKTFAGAISKTAAGGEISVLDPAGYGTVTITKSITIEGTGTLASVLNAGVPGIVINAGPTDTVILRDLSINGFNSGTNGIRFLAGAGLTVDHCSIFGQTQDDIDVSSSTPGRVMVRDTTMTGGATGVNVGGTAGPMLVTLDHVNIHRCNTGIYGGFGASNVINSVIADTTGYGVLAITGGVINCDGCTLTGNATAVRANTNSTVRLSDTDVMSNVTGIFAGVGVVESAGNNHIRGNSTNGAPTATYTPL
jgi:hypothetical protein